MSKELEVLKDSNYMFDLGNIKKDIQAGKISYSLSEIENSIQFIQTIEGKILGNKIGMFCSIAVILLSFFSGIWMMFLGIGLIVFIGISNSQIQKENNKIIDIIVLYRRNQLGVTRVSSLLEGSHINSSQAIISPESQKTKLLEELFKLKQDGALTDEEFQAEKKKILSK